MALTTSDLPSQPAENPFGALPREALGLESEQHIAVIKGYNCTEAYISPDNDGNFYAAQRPYHYDIVLEFQDRESRQAFVKDRDVTDHVNTIMKTTESMMQETLQLENERDFDNGLKGADLNDPSIIEGINNEGTHGDIDYIEGELGAIFQSTFPDAGIASVKIQNISGADRQCGNPNDWNYAESTSPSLQTVNAAHLNRFTP